METSVSITSDILEQALLLNVETGMWSGKTSQDEVDLEAQGANSQAEIFTKGQKLLVPKTALEPFARIKGRIVQYLRREARHFYIKSTWIVSRDARERVSAEMAKFEQDWNDTGDRFIANLPAYKQTMLAVYRDKYPTLVERIEAQYPTDETIRAKCRLHWTFGAWQMAQIEGAAEEMEQQFRARANSYLSQLEQEVYVSSVEAAVAMARGMGTKSGEISDKKIAKFHALINRIRQDNTAFLNSERIQSFLTSVDENMMNVANWQTEGAAKEKVKASLESYIEEASKTAEAAAIASVYIRRVQGNTETETPEPEDSVASVRRVSAEDADTEEEEEGLETVDQR